MLSWNPRIGFNISKCLWSYETYKQTNAYVLPTKKDILNLLTLNSCPSICIISVTHVELQFKFRLTEHGNPMLIFDSVEFLLS